MLGETAFGRETVARGEAALGAARLAAYEAVRAAWQRALDDRPMSGAERARYRLMLLHAARAAGDVIDLVYRASGSAAVFDSNPISRFFRDWHTAAQHIFLSPANFAEDGEILLAVEEEPSGA